MPTAAVISSQKTPALSGAAMTVQPEAASTSAAARSFGRGDCVDVPHRYGSQSGTAAGLSGSRAAGSAPSACTRRRNCVTAAGSAPSTPMRGRSFVCIMGIS